MRLRRIALSLAILLLASFFIAGCSDEASTETGSTQDTTEQNGLEVGTQAPEFRLKNQDQTTVALSDYKGTKNVILVFYPADFTPV
jgi:cytochrome oxidase Cu insertion factor (SCO1/SenC/PrrC family)